VWKFRTMVSDADEVLEDYLEQNPVAKREWDDNHKLKDDPRVTRVGKFLRRSSLDELPQLINILTGEMSLVGPRPIVEAEIANYGRYYQVYQQVKPGLTGLWQISGRNDVDYQLRVQMDYTYVRNWSVWLDLYILVNTPFAVLSGTGAY
jgi:lipopolysaccharide/colanic/teichoic acid biosynthesis glycosyltransferase